jgi:hypothetical protein
MRFIKQVVIPCMTTTVHVKQKKTDWCIGAGTQSRAPLVAFILTLDGVSSAHNCPRLEAKRFCF